MRLLFIDQWLDPAAVHALGWTLIHSVWQGLIALLLALGFLGLTKKSRSTLRYNTLLLILGLFVAGCVFTFAVQYRSHTNSEGQTIIAQAQVSADVVTETVFFNPLPQRTSLLTGLENFFNDYADLIVAVWFIVFSILSLRFCTGFGYIYRIRHYRNAPASAHWLDKLEVLKKELGIRQPVMLLESAIVKVPLAVGYFKPLILIPVGLLANLPPAQVESILLHELAHIRRGDYFVNLLQNLLETIFFFNPAVLWISSVIKEERELCCDDVALRQAGSKSVYVQALLSFQEYKLRADGYGLAFPGRKGLLLNRVTRIVNNENKKLNAMEKIVLAGGLLIIATAALLPAKEARAQVLSPDKTPQVQMPSGNNASVIRKDTVPEKKELKTSSSIYDSYLNTRVSTSHDGKNENVKVQATEKNGRKIEAHMVDNIVTNLFINSKPVSPSDFNDYTREIAAMRKLREAQAQYSAQSSGTVEVPPVPLIEPVLPLAQEEGAEKTAVLPETEDSYQQTEEILKLLKEKGVIKGKEGTSFELNYEAFVVNRNKLDADLHELLKKKYLYKKGDYYTFTSEGGTSSITVHRE